MGPWRKCNRQRCPTPCRSGAIYTLATAQQLYHLVFFWVGPRPTLHGAHCHLHGGCPQCQYQGATEQLWHGSGAGAPPQRLYMCTSSRPPGFKSSPGLGVAVGVGVAVTKPPKSSSSKSAMFGWVVGGWVGCATGDSVNFFFCGSYLGDIELGRPFRQISPIFFDEPHHHHRDHPSHAVASHAGWLVVSARYTNPFFPAMSSIFGGTGGAAGGGQRQQGQSCNWFWSVAAAGTCPLRRERARPGGPASWPRRVALEVYTCAPRAPCGSRARPEG